MYNKLILFIINIINMSNSILLNCLLIIILINGDILELVGILFLRSSILIFSCMIYCLKLLFSLYKINT